MANNKELDALLQILSGEQTIIQRTDQKAFTLLSILGAFMVFFIVHFTNMKLDIQSEEITNKTLRYKKLGNLNKIYFSSFVNSINVNNIVADSVYSSLVKGHYLNSTHINSDNIHDYAPKGGHLSIAGYEKFSDLLNKNIKN